MPLWRLKHPVSDEHGADPSEWLEIPSADPDWRVFALAGNPDVKQLIPVLGERIDPPPAPPIPDHPYRSLYSARPSASCPS